jgi:Autotransporter beta-domain
MPTTTAPTTTTTSPTTTPTTRTSRAIDLAGRLVIAPALLFAPFVAIDRAAAQCAPKSPVNNATVTCTGKTTNQNGTNGYGTATDTGNTINVQSGASVTGTANGLLFNDGTVKNLGTITGGVNGAGIFGSTATVFNSGTITAGTNGAGISVFTANVTNSSTGTITGDRFAIFAAGTATVFNSGTITAGKTGFAISADTVNLNNSGSVTQGALGFALSANTANVNNSGSIGTAAQGIGISANTVNLVNSGTITAGTAILAGNGNSIINNSGTISVVGGSGISIGSNGTADITNSGTIIARLGATAIHLGNNNADRLTLLPGSRILGIIDMGGGKDVVNLARGGGVAQLVTLNNFTGTINTSGVGPIVHNTSQIATLDPTAFGQTDRTLMDFTGGVSSLVQSRLGGAPPNGSIQAVSYAPDGAMPNGLIRKAPFAGYAAPTVVWTGGFGGTRTQDATGDFFRATSSVWGGLLGVDRQVRGDLLIGGFVGGGTGRLTINKSSEGVHTDYLAGGVYGRFDWASHFLDFTVQGGSAENKSNRLVMSNLALSTNGLETATARYSGWYVSPELTYGMRYAIGNGNMLTPFARVRYLAGIFDGYSEQGSGQNLSVGRRTLQDVEERGELELSRTASFGSEATMKASVHGGVIALQRLGDTNINTVLIGQNLTFAMPGKDSTVGAVAGTGVDVTIGKSVSVFGAVEGTVMSDKSRTGTAKAGLRVGF